MSFEADYEYALELHNLLNSSSQENYDDNDIKCVDFKKPSQIKLKKKRINPRSNLDADHIYRMQNLIHPQWETLDPTPDIFALFGQFDKKFFQCRLKCVTLEWGKRMHSCAGICYSRKYCDKKGITMRLSEPLLALRQRKDLIETMLHEMIHAYCFVLHIRESNGGHGPKFKKIMNAVNKVSGTNITVYHTFRDEKKSCNLYWWCCNGVCQERSPFYGHVVRTSSDAPGPDDIWWAKHQEECGGTLMKIKGPAEKLKLKKIKKSNKEKKKSSDGSSESRENFTSDLNTTNAHLINAAGRSKSNDLGAMSLGSTASVAKAFPPTSYPGLSSDPFSVLINRPTSEQTSSSSSVPRGNLHNVVGLKDVGNTSKPSSSNASGWGKGTSLSQESDQHSTSENHIDRQFLRSVWEKRWNDGIDGNRQKNADESGPTVDIKRKRISNDDTPPCPSDVTCTSVEDSSCAKNRKDWVPIDEDIMVQENSSDDVITLSSGEDNDDQDDEEYEIYTPTINQKMTSAERQRVIKKEIIDESIDLCESDIELIDDEFDDNFEQSYEMTASSGLPDTSVINKYFGSNNFLKEFQKDNDLIASGSRLNSTSEIVTCPICETKMPRWQFAKHLNGCTGITLKIQPPKLAFKKLPTNTKEEGSARFSSKTAKNILRNAGYLGSDSTQTDLLSSFGEDDERELDTFFESSGINPSENNTIDLSSSPDDENIKRFRQRSIYKTTWQCPRCAREVEETDVPGHLIICARKGKKNRR